MASALPWAALGQSACTCKKLRGLHTHVNSVPIHLTELILPFIELLVCNRVDIGRTQIVNNFCNRVDIGRTQKSIDCLTDCLTDCFTQLILLSVVLLVYGKKIRLSFHQPRPFDGTRFEPPRSTPKTTPRGPFGCILSFHQPRPFDGTSFEPPRSAPKTSRGPAAGQCS